MDSSGSEVDTGGSGPPLLLRPPLPLLLPCLIPHELMVGAMKHSQKVEGAELRRTAWKSPEASGRGKSANAGSDTG
jgi:hypothetical protein